MTVNPHPVVVKHLPDSLRDETGRGYLGLGGHSLTAKYDSAFVK